MSIQTLAWTEEKNIPHPQKKGFASPSQTDTDKLEKVTQTLALTENGNLVLKCF